MKILFRVDSSNLIGSGHLMRCLTMAQRYRKEGHRVCFVCRDLEGNLAGLVKEQEFRLFILPTVERDDTLTGYGKWLAVSQEFDATETVSLIKEMDKVGRVVVDSYAIDETSKAIKALRRLKANGELPDVEITVVVGGSNARKDDVAIFCQKAGFKYLCQVNNMAELMAEADLMLGAGGTTTWERCFLTLPSIVTAVAENQFQICEDCATAGIINYLGHWNNVSVDDIYQAVRKFADLGVFISMQKKMSQLFL